MTSQRFSVVAAVNNRRVLEGNLLLSPSLAQGDGHELLIQEGFSSASTAYNHAIDAACNDILVFVHQDIYLPEHWFEDVSRAIQALEARGTRWGVLGCFGVRRGLTEGLGRVFTTGRHLHGTVIHAPEAVETLDEIVLVIRKSTGLRFDPGLPHFHLYGTDVCLHALSLGMENYAIPAFCVHNTNQLIELPDEFYRCYFHIKEKWFSHLPIYTSCIRISRFDGDLYRGKWRGFARKLLRRAPEPLARVEDPRSLLSAEEWRSLRVPPENT